MPSRPRDLHGQGLRLVESELELAGGIERPLGEDAAVGPQHLGSCFLRYVVGLVVTFDNHAPIDQINLVVGQQAMSESWLGGQQHSHERQAENHGRWSRLWQAQHVRLYSRKESKGATKNRAFDERDGQ